MWIRLCYFCVLLLSMWPCVSWSQFLPDDDFAGRGEEFLELERSLFFRADDVYVSLQEGIVEARGNVRVEGQGMKLQARSMFYNLEERELRMEGRVTMSIAGYGSLMTEKIEIDIDENYAVTEAMHGLFFNHHKFAASSSEIDLDDKEMNVLRGTYTFCPVCTPEEREEGGSLIPKPVWQLKVGQIVQGDKGRYMILKNISMELFTVGFPLLFFPELRLLSPEIERESGFLFVQSGVNAAGLFFGIPYFFAWDEDTNLVIAPYLGTSHSLLGLDYESVGKRWKLETKSLWKAKTGEKKGVKEAEIGRWGIEGRYEYGLDEYRRVRGEWDVVSDTYFTKDYEGLYKRSFPRYAPSEGSLNFEYFDSDSYGVATLGFADNLYGDTPLYDRFLGGRWWSTHGFGGGTRGILGMDIFSVREDYRADAWEDNEGFDEREEASGWLEGEARAELERRQVRGGLLWETRFGVHGLLRSEEGRLYHRLMSSSGDGIREPRFFEEREGSREWLELRSKSLVRWPWVREEEGGKWLLTPFAGVTAVGHIVGERERGLREELYLPHRQVFEKGSRAVMGEGMDVLGVRALAGSDILFSHEDLGDVSLYGGVSMRVGGGELEEEVSLRALDNDMFFGGGKLLWGRDRVLTYDVVRDLKRDKNVKEQAGISFSWDDTSRFALGYTHVNDAESHIGLSMVGARLKTWLTEEFEVEVFADRDVIGGDYYDYKAVLNYVVPCLKVSVTWNETLKRDYRGSDARLDSRVLFGVNIFTDQAYSRPSWREVSEG